MRKLAVSGQVLTAWGWGAGAVLVRLSGLLAAHHCQGLPSWTDVRWSLAGLENSAHHSPSFILFNQSETVWPEKPYPVFLSLTANHDDSYSPDE